MTDLDDLIRNLRPPAVWTADSIRPSLEIFRAADAWRLQLTTARSLRAVSLVSRSMTELAAQNAAAAMNAQMEALGKALGPRFTFPSPVDLSVLASSFHPLFRAAAQAAAIDWAARFRDWTEEERELDRRLRPSGWWVAASWTAPMAREVLDIARHQGKRAVDEALCEHYREHRLKRLRELIEPWWEDPAYKLRRPIILEAMRNHADGRYRSSIPMLLPQLEGIAADVFEPHTPRTAVPSIVAGGAVPAVGPYGGLVTETLLALLTGLWSRHDFGASPLSRKLNRHAILHGRTVRYGSEPSSLKVFLALDQLASEVRRKREGDERLAKVAS